MKGFINLTHTNNARVDRKIDKLSNGTYVVGNIPKINENGELEDSGYNRLIHVISDITELKNIEVGYIMLYIGVDTIYNGFPITSNKMYQYEIINTGSHDNIIIKYKFVEVLDYLTSTEIQTIVNDINTDINGIKELIPAQATSSNKLADKDFVNSSIATSTATYRGNYNIVSDLNLSKNATYLDVATALSTTISTSDNNDYCFVQIPISDLTPTSIERIDRYKYNGSAWSYEYTLNNSGFTSNQWNAINSGATTENINDIANKVNKSTTIAGIDLQDNITTEELQNALSDNAHRFVTDAEKTAYNNKANKSIIADYTLVVANWSNNTYTLNVTGKTENNNAIVSNSNTGTDADVLANAQAIANANIYKITDNGTSLTFTCETTPITDLRVQVEVYD